MKIKVILMGLLKYSIVLLALLIISFLFLRLSYTIAHSKNKQKYIAAVAGKSGGHIVPAMTILQHYISKHSEYSVLFFSTDTELDKNIVKLYPFVSLYVPLTFSDNPRKSLLSYIYLLGNFIKSSIMSLKYLYTFKPEKIISTGGRVAFPVGLAAWAFGIPIELYELNAVPGRAALWLAYFSQKINVCFEAAKHFFSQSKVQLVPYPLRFSEKDKINKEQACARLGLDSNKKTLLVLGGSQGSKYINDLVSEFVKVCPDKTNSHIQIIHQAGPYNLDYLRNLYKSLDINALVFNYTQDLQLCYSAADLVIARAGAGTLFELEFFNKKAIIIPLEAATTTHQVDNAQAMVHQRPDLFTCIVQSAIDAHKSNFFSTLCGILAK